MSTASSRAQKRVDWLKANCPHLNLPEQNKHQDMPLPTCIFSDGASSEDLLRILREIREKFEKNNPQPIPMGDGPTEEQEMFKHNHVRFSKYNIGPLNLTNEYTQTNLRTDGVNDDNCLAYDVKEHITIYRANMHLMIDRSKRVAQNTTARRNWSFIPTGTRSFYIKHINTGEYLKKIANYGLALGNPFEYSNEEVKRYAWYCNHLIPEVNDNKNSSPDPYPTEDIMIGDNEKIHPQRKTRIIRGNKNQTNIMTVKSEARGMHYLGIDDEFLESDRGRIEPTMKQYQVASNDIFVWWQKDKWIEKIRIENFPFEGYKQNIKGRIDSITIYYGFMIDTFIVHLKKDYNPFPNPGPNPYPDPQPNNNPTSKDHYDIPRIQGNYHTKIIGSNRKHPLSKEILNTGPNMENHFSGNWNCEGLTCLQINSNSGPSTKYESTNYQNKIENHVYFKITWEEENKPYIKNIGFNKNNNSQLYVHIAGLIHKIRIAYTPEYIEHFEIWYSNPNFNYEEYHKNNIIKPDPIIIVNPEDEPNFDEK